MDADDREGGGALTDGARLAAAHTLLRHLQHQKNAPDAVLAVALEALAGALAPLHENEALLAEASLAQSTGAAGVVDAVDNIDANLSIALESLP